ncbi:MAG: 2-C-methyl-D-erythritol 2,4-cyclodiphosphate synthase [Nitrospirota bacterium]
MTRVGIGYDVHALVPGRPLVLGGVVIPFARGLAGHSDADALLHAVANALLGAAALGDIGQHFPNSDPAYRDVASIRLLELVVDRITEQGFEVGNVDAMVIAEAPKLAPYVARMRAVIAKALRVPDSAVSVKATTHEGLGSLGRGDGIAAQAVCLLREREGAR